MDYKSTLNLPKTSFPMKADLPKREPGMLAHWQTIDLYGQIRQARAGAAPFILHDGPPYANGDIHIGHTLNKVLKDVIVRYQTMRGCDAPYVPGWDCHGMPIEHQLFKELKITKQQIAQTAFREKARAYAQRYAEIQREQFKRLGVLGDWDHPYLTMARDYELTILRIFRELLQAGYIYYGKKPVYWCATCETALAEAEVGYEDRQDRSIYVAFPVKTCGARIIVPAGVWEGASIAVWTTTPWTLPANVALCFHPDHQYALVRAKKPDGKEVKLVMAEALRETVLGKLGLQQIEVLPLADGKTLANQLVGGGSTLVCRRPLGGDDSVGVTDNGVSLDEGTGVVHIAPGHGQEDHLIGQRYKLETLSPVDHQGRFTKDVPAYAGQTVFDANPRIIAELKQRGLLLAEEPITHSYPHCWRCKQPVIFRATPQWFLSVEHEQLRARLLKAAAMVQWIPAAGLSRMTGMLQTRPDWCLSRQRYWGTPIPMLHCTTCQKAVTDVKVVEAIERTLSERGIDAWFTLTPSELAPDAACPTCPGGRLRKETDILDVWFDSGVSHEAVLKARAGLRWPATMYLEGSDQHRGWFQVSMIPAVALRDRPPYEQVLTHGFVMDGQGRKMSKSLGNVVAPQDVMKRYGADILRLWAASSDYREDVRISEEILAQVAESYKKIRNTFRFLLANLHDFDPRHDRVEIAGGPEVDRWMHHRTGELLAAMTRSYDAYQFHDAVKGAYHFCVVELSSFYLDVLKDRLYTEAVAAPTRRCAQTVLYDILTALVAAFAPILSITTDEVWHDMVRAGWVQEPSVHLARWPDIAPSAVSEDLQQRWTTVRSLREIVMKALEGQRARGLIGSPLEAHVTLLVADDALRRMCEQFREALAEVFVVSGVGVQRDEPPRAAPNAQMAGVPGAARAMGAGLVDVRVERAPGAKCGRCWRHLESVGRDAAHPQLCDRCVRVVTLVKPVWPVKPVEPVG